MDDNNKGSIFFGEMMVVRYPVLYDNLFTTPSGVYSNYKTREFISKNKLPKGTTFQQILEYIGENEDMHDWWML